MSRINKELKINNFASMFNEDKDEYILPILSDGQDVAYMNDHHKDYDYYKNLFCVSGLLFDHYQHVVNTISSIVAHVPEGKDKDLILDYLKIAREFTNKIESGKDLLSAEVIQFKK